MLGTFGVNLLDLKVIAIRTLSDLPQMEGDQQLSLELEVKLSNDQILTAPGGVWYNNDDGLLSAVG